MEFLERPPRYRDPNLDPTGVRLRPKRLAEGVYALMAFPSRGTTARWSSASTAPWWWTPASTRPWPARSSRSCGGSPTGPSRRGER